MGHFKHLAAAFAAFAAAAHAQPEKPGGIWEGCGGDARPSGVAKFMVGPKMAAAHQPKTPPAVTVEQCTAALDSLGAAAPWQTRAAFLRSRARAYLADLQPNPALADIAAIRAIEQSDPVYARSFGLSLTMLEAIAAMQRQDFPTAARAAQAALAARPWSDRIAQFSYRVLSATGAHGAESRAVLDRLVRYDPDLVEVRATELMLAREWDQAARDWLRVKPMPGEVSTTYIDLPNVRVTGAPGIPVTDLDEGRAGRAALALAMAGMTDQAAAILKSARTALATPPQAPPYLKHLKLQMPQAASRGQILDRWAVLVDSATAWRAGNLVRAREIVRPLDWTQVDALQLILLDTIGGDASGIPDAKGALRQMEEDRVRRLRTQFRPDELLAELPDYERASKTNPYRKSVMFLRASGFRTAPAKSGVGTDIHMFGDKTSSLSVSEMALLRAAELALAEGKPGFVITQRRGYRQTMQQTIYGSPIGPVADAGNGVDLTIVAADRAALPAQLQGHEDRVLDAHEVRDALAPLYLGEPAPARP